MNDLQAQHLIDQIGAAYVDPQAAATDLFTELESSAMHQFTDAQWQALQRSLDALRDAELQ
ncbi:MAG TPA: hypothetical protein VFN35_04935 [Ktedonobacteraceae bacterium]|nr:hypothetical protein [Ktedonobacteraceae bacterium]